MTNQQERDFRAHIDLLGNAIEWIQVNLSPGEVFKEADLIEWASESCNPEDIFSQNELHDWAESVGYNR